VQRLGHHVGQGRVGQVGRTEDVALVHGGLPKKESGFTTADKGKVAL
jgi:hypothetical protein